MPVNMPPNMPVPPDMGSYLSQFPIYDTLPGVDPAVRQQMALAQALRRQQEGTAMANANAQGHSLDNMAAIAQMANNPAAADAAGTAAKFTQQRYAPVQLGNTGFALPATGQFAENPMYADDRAAARESSRALQEGNQIMRQSIAATQAAQRARGQDVGGAVRIIVGQGHDQVGEDRIANQPDKTAQQTQKQTQQYSKLLDTDQVPAFASALDTVAGHMSSYPVGQLPGYGKVLSALPSSVLGLVPGQGDVAQSIRADMARAANTLLRMQSGLAVTEPEQRRFLEQVQQGVGLSEAALRHGWAGIQHDFNAKIRNINSGFSPDALAQYRDNGGKDYTNLPEPTYENNQPQRPSAASQIPGGGAGGAPTPADINAILQKHGVTQ